VALPSIDGLNSWLTATNKPKTRQNVPGSIFPSDDTADASAADASDPTSAFTAFINETPAQRMQDAWLQQHGVTQQQFNALSADDKQKLLDQMKRDLEERMKEQAAQNTAPKGSQVNILA